MTEHTTETHTENAHANDDTTVIAGRVLPFPVYTTVYIALAVLTAIEISLSQVERGFLTIPVMIVIALCKAGLVVWFYMHLNKDSRIFALALIIPFVMVVLATLFLLLVPPGGY